MLDLIYPSGRNSRTFSVKDLSAGSGVEHTELFSRRKLLSIRQKALRKAVWFKVLSRVERGLVSLTIRCVEHVQSSKLTAILRGIVGRLEEALGSRVDKLMREVGWPSARKMACLAVSWGNRDALNWVFDARFARYLTVAHLNDSEMFKQ